MEAEDLEGIKDWMEEVPFTRTNCLKNLTREFSDAVCCAEVLSHYCPKFVDMNHYHPVSNKEQKVTQWQTLNAKALKKLGLSIPASTIQKIVANQPGYVEMVLRNIKLKVEQFQRGELVVDESESTEGSSKKKKGKKGKKKKGGGTAALAVPGDDASADGASTSSGPSVDEEAVSALMLKDKIIDDYEEVVKVFQAKIKKMDTLMRMKEKRIDDLERKCRENGLGLK